MTNYMPTLVDRARLAINCLTEHCDKSRGYLPYFYTRLNDRPPTAYFAIWSYGDGLGRAVDALTLARAMTGDHVEHTPDINMRATLIGLLGVDGLSWCPATPWTMPVPHTRPHWLQQGTLLGLTSLYLFTGEQRYRDLAETNIRAVTAMSHRNERGDLDFPGGDYTVYGWSKPGDDPMHRFSVFSTSITMPLMRYFRATGFEPALQLASGLMDWAIHDHRDGQDLFALGHFHCQSRLVAALLMRGLATGSRADIQFAEQLYLKARSLGTESGWFPEQINNPDQNRSNLSETCCLTDMLEIAFLLAQNVDFKYWHDAERFARNHLMVHQVLDTDWFADSTPIAREKHPLRNVLDEDGREVGAQQRERWRQSLIGAFAGWGGVTAMSDDSGFSNSNQQCCNAAGARALYDAWHYAVTDDGQALQVNLHLARRHPAAAIEVAFDPAGTGVETLTIRMQSGRKVSVRIPEFTAASEIRVTRNNQPLNAGERAGFLDIGKAGAGDTITLAWPLKERVSRERIAPGEFTFHWRGPIVMRAEPVQKLRPLFTDDRFSAAAPAEQPAAQKEIASL